MRVSLQWTIGLVAAAASCTTALASELKQVGTIEIPGQRLTNFDISFIDQATGLYYLADRSNKAIDSFDTKAERFMGRAGGFVGSVMKDGKIASAVLGPDGVVFTGTEIWAGDGDSTVKIIDPATETVTAVIATGGRTRVDEMAYDPKDRVFIGVNNAENPPYATLISTRPGHAIIGKVVLANATDGAEQPTYNPDDGLFYMSIPEFDKDPKKGGVAVIDARTNKLLQMVPIQGGTPHSVTSSEASGHVLVPVGAMEDGDGTVHVYAPS